MKDVEITRIIPGGEKCNSSSPSLAIKFPFDPASKGKSGDPYTLIPGTEDKTH